MKHEKDDDDDDEETTQFDTCFADLVLIWLVDWLVDEWPDSQWSFASRLMIEIEI